MFFPIDADKWGQALGQIRRLRHRGSLEGLPLVNRALSLYGDRAVGKARALLVRAIFHQQLRRDSAQAALDLLAVLELIEPKNSASEARLWVAAVHNLNYAYAVGCSDFQTLRTTLRRVHSLGKSLSKNEGHRRALCNWTEALLLAPLGATRSAARLLAKARSWLFRNRFFHTGTLCAVDLGLLQMRDGETQGASETMAELRLYLAAAGLATATYLELSAGLSAIPFG